MTTDACSSAAEPDRYSIVEPIPRHWWTLQRDYVDNGLLGWLPMQASPERLMALIRALDIRMRGGHLVWGLFASHSLKQIQNQLERLQGDPVPRSILCREAERGDEWIHLLDLRLQQLRDAAPGAFPRRGAVPQHDCEKS